MVLEILFPLNECSSSLPHSGHGLDLSMHVRGCSHLVLFLITETYPYSHGSLFLQELQSFLVRFSLTVSLPVSLELYGFVFIAAEVAEPFLVWPTDEQTSPLSLQLHYQWLIGLHQCPTVIICCHFGNHTLR